MTLDERAAQDAAAHLDRLDRVAPGAVTAMHVTGSATLDDYRRGSSDLDLYVELAHEVDRDVLAAAHQDVGCMVETLYLPAGSLDGSLTRLSAVPWVVAVPTSSDPREQLNPVTQLTLARYSATLRGARPTVAVDVPAAKAYWRRTVADYWQGQVEEREAALPDLAAGAPVPTFGLLWLALGIARVWHNIRSGEVVSKTTAGGLAAAHWPDLADALRDIIDVRAGKDVELTFEHATATVTLGRRVLAELD